MTLHSHLHHDSLLLTLKDEEIGYTNHIALNKISLAISKGEKIAVIGRSGAGKTTLLRRLYTQEKNKCSFVHQNQTLVTQLSVFHNIYMGRLDKQSLLQNVRNLIKPSPAALMGIQPIAESLGIAEKLFTSVGELSGGQQQRVGIGRAIYQGGSILLADEPVSSLDRIQQDEIMKMLVNAAQTVIAALHSIRLTRKYFTRTVGLKNNTILFDLPCSSVNDPLIAELYG